MLTLPLPAPSLRTTNRLPARRVLRRIHNDLIRIILSPLRWVIPTANQIFSLLSGRAVGRGGSPCELAHRHRPRPVHIWDVGAAEDAHEEELMSKPKYGALRGRAVAAAEER